MNENLLNDLYKLRDELDPYQKKSYEAKEIELKFIKRLIDTRKSNGLSQKELAERTGLTQQAISSIEKCDRKPTLLNLIKYLLGLGIDINSIFN
ncbi:helix-turn-helix transcriptional regulator (plasmid) [Clostridium perfringens]|jgi:DNA-binding XRE family transcriptional regulator|uniref:helix-turn-helix transcriptional regulator n=1 Tax=Clostridia TaxID=186801 RepID=UPI001A22DB8F|nr:MULTISPECIES: helix-turn-helix transcriptional regulator [Clostridiaceae]EJT5915413.1 helix-turn-helix transcriptional regulator [Clostridium perfringens]EJT6615250.1 helix-turn-helix transcriptional regulator [Clostridium perfringens]MBS5954909.1 helix-turn-helix transcriptional regulator [Paraclostridium bifermentans]MDH5096472.1 DNA-binding transcriptional repressor PuuR [Clostridium perfringens]UYC94383.1 helix-turn-helix transcriptional regulator [Clostridium perfringens]